MTTADQVAQYLIEDQMADLTDAIREAVQNGVDSPGSSRVLVSVTPHRTVVCDDGAGVDLGTEQGTRDLSVLGAGTKTRADDTTLGEWGIGTGAIIAKGAVRLWSGQHALCFDYQDRREAEPFGTVSGREGVVLATDHAFDGVCVRIDHYETEVPDPDSYRWQRIYERLHERFGYLTFQTDVDVVVNGESVDRGHPFDAVANSRVAVTRETADAYLALEHAPEQGLDIYSNGLYVMTDHDAGVGGGIVSKGNLTLNFARTAVQSGCERWGRIQDTLADARIELYDQLSDTALDGQTRAMMAELMTTDQTLRERWRDRDLFQLATETPVSLAQVQTVPQIGVQEGASHGADALVERGTIILDTTDPATKQLVQAADTPETDVTLPDTFDVATRAQQVGVWQGYSQLADTELTTRQARYLLFARALADAIGIDRSIAWGEATADAWTDGRTQIVVTDSAVTSSKRVVWSHDIFLTLCHEAAHDRSDKNRTAHGRRFESRFRELVEDPEVRAAYTELVTAIHERGFTQVFADRGVSIG
ncbi:ATP-binding protein [Halorubrum sp. CBA1125]|uniref:ATP-binding protein n=1 Tax=Halorubrum sp. CBA1125 TaxID=2668072 RepID=UPI0012E812C4|nr:ATP-binding protein [Halorubrum sp. CBA1125]